jgi:hypothetical protein
MDFLHTTNNDINNVTNANTILGLPDHLWTGQQERVDELNDRMTSRQFPDSPLQPNFDPRPVPTKYAHFPIINRRKHLNEPVIPYLDYHGSVNFNPGTHRAPPSGYMNSVETENRLRNQYFALQHGSQGTYVPSSNSDLYRTVVPGGSQNEAQPFTGLFERPTFDPSPHPNTINNNIGKDWLYNHTRVQLRGREPTV